MTFILRGVGIRDLEEVRTSKTEIPEFRDQSYNHTSRVLANYLFRRSRVTHPPCRNQGHRGCRIGSMVQKWLEYRSRARMISKAPLNSWEIAKQPELASPSVQPCITLIQALASTRSGIQKILGCRSRSIYPKLQNRLTTHWQLFGWVLKIFWVSRYPRPVGVSIWLRATPPVELNLILQYIRQVRQLQNSESMYGAQRRHQRILCAVDAVSKEA
jgi:hypothetical protein